MATQIAVDPAHRRVTVEEFLDMDLGDGKAELVDGVIFMMAGGNKRHNRVCANLLSALDRKLAGSACQPYGSDQALRTATGSIRYPDISVYCEDADDLASDDAVFLGDPKVVFEVFSTSTMLYDQRDKLDEYRALAGVECIVMLEPNDGRVRLLSKTGPEAWFDRWQVSREDIALDCLGITLPYEDVFRRR